MTDFNKLLKDCKEVSAVSALVIDQFLMYYAADRDGLGREVDQRLGRFRSITRQFETSWVNRIKAQYICHRIFKEGGLIKKYLNHPEVKALPAGQYRFLQENAINSWRYSFSEIIAKPAKDFFEMEDVFNGETYILHSPSMTNILSVQAVSLWFNLIMFNGSCWQTFGPLVSFQSFDPDDIFYFACACNPAIDSEEALMADVESNPIPYLMLIQASNRPGIMQGRDEIVQVVAEHDLEKLDSDRLRPDFTLEYSKGVYRISALPWRDPPHFAVAYYIEKNKTLRLNAMTDRGFRNLVKGLNKKGFTLDADPDVHVHLPMLTAVKDILGKHEELDPYERLFAKKEDPKDAELMERLNRLLQLALPYINSGKQPDVEALAKEAGVEVEMARELLSKSMGRINKLRGSK